MEKLEKRITKSQENRMKKGMLTGCHIIVNRGGECLLNKTYGRKSEAGELLREDAVYRIASMTKPVTAAALLIEQEKGRLNIYDDAAKYLDGFGSMYTVSGDGMLKPVKNKIKLYMLVSHTSGINSAAVEGEANPMPYEYRNLETVTDFAAGLPLLFEPGTAQQYNTAGFDIAARVIELTSGMSFDEYLKENIFDKLGMKDTTFVPTGRQWSRMVAIHDRKGKKAIDKPMERKSVIDGYPLTYFAAGCALVSTAGDYSRFAQMLLNGGKGDNGVQIMSSESVKLMTTPVVTEAIMPGSQKWGLGVRVISDDEYVLPKGSFGWSGMYGSHFWVDPVNRVTAVYMKNSAFDGGAGCMSANEFEKDVMKIINKL